MIYKLGSYKNDIAPIPTCHLSLYFEKKKKKTLKLSPQQMINCEKFYDCLLNLLVIEVMLYFMPIKKTKLEPYIPIILERDGNYNVIFWYRYLFIFYFGITSLSLSLSLSLSIYIYIYILHSVCFVVTFFTTSKLHWKIKIFSF